MQFLLQYSHYTDRFVTFSYKNRELKRHVSSYVLYNGTARGRLLSLLFVFYFYIFCVVPNYGLLAEPCYMINPLKTKRRLLYLKTQSVPRCKHFSSRL